ncbi:uncharacterized protein LOC121936704 isoform X2 [Sceloporus undulatus]|uniref:uncharacterized protein LOC121936704 isoform X2 n=1 Tax=Sceloporus undulatus TaxID=8520 RepID=UPI001C4CBC54|nr:uncharacterized protein LOC121936704 isoform X2 [Sceloporus undulatus]
MTSNMEATQELSIGPEVQLQQKYWITEDSKANLLTAGAECLETVIQSEHYYDTASDELATADLWLSQRNEQWCLVVDSQKQRDGGNVTKSVPKMQELPCQDLRENVTNDKPTDCCGFLGLGGHVPEEFISDVSPTSVAGIFREDKPTICKGLEEKSTESELLPNQNNHSHEFTESGAHTKDSSTYTELVRESDIMTYLAGFFNIDLKGEDGGNVTMEDFLQMTGIQHYASNHTVLQATYLLSNRYTIVIQRDECTLKESATIRLEADVLNICKGFEEIEKLGNYLGFIQSEQALTI